MTFREYKNNGGTYDKMIFGNDAGSFGHKGSTIYGYTPAMEEWEVVGVRFEDSGSKTLVLNYRPISGKR